MENLDFSRTFYKNYGRIQPCRAAKYSQCGWATYLFYGTRKCRFHATVAASLQVRPSLQYATANNEDETRVDIYASGFWGGKQTSEGIFYVKVKAIAPSYHGSYPSSYPHRSLSTFLM